MQKDSNDFKSIDEGLVNSQCSPFSDNEKSSLSSFKRIDVVAKGIMSRKAQDAVRKRQSDGTVLTGFHQLDEALQGLRGGDLVIIGARPDVGKTTLVSQIAVNAAKKGVPVAFFSLEMSSDHFAVRLISSKTKTKLTDLCAKLSSGMSDESVTNACDQLSALDIYIDDTLGPTTMEIRVKTRRLWDILGYNRKGLIIIDYLQFIREPLFRDKFGRAEEIDAICTELKNLAIEMGVPVIVTSQLHSSVEWRPHKRPTVFDINKSGSVAQNADVVMLLDRSMDEEEAAEPHRPDLGTMNVIIAKNDNGTTGDVALAFNP